MIDPVRLVILPFLENWDGTNLAVRLLVVPRGNPLAHISGATGPSFAAANFKFALSIAPADALPNPLIPPVSTFTSPADPKAVLLLQEIEASLPIDATPAAPFTRPVGTTIKKYLPKTYQSASGYAPGRTPNVYTDSSYFCLLKSPSNTQPAPAVPVVTSVTWGQAIALLLRNPKLARTAGLIRDFPSFPITDPTILKSGGFVYVSLDASGDGGDLVGTEGLKFYAAQLPPIALGTSRTIFTPVLFPVVANPPNLDYSDMFSEVQDYNDGWAKVVHAFQPQSLNYLNEDADDSGPAKELGIRLGWDDEQVTTWLGRQVTDDPTQAGLDSPLGVRGYRVDGRIQPSGLWASLNTVQGPLKFGGGLDLGTFDGELNVETQPSKSGFDKEGDYWLPQYFTTWSGGSLVGVDYDRVLFGGGPDQTSQPNGLVGVGPTNLPLVYGKSYEFRVRLVDHTFGGPTFSTADATSLNPALHPVAKIDFRRWVRPQSPICLNKPPTTFTAPTSLQFSRPLINYPAVLCTNYYTNVVQLLRNDLPSAAANRREPGLPDPDTVVLQIIVEVQGLAQDPETGTDWFQTAYIATRAFPSNPLDVLNIRLQYEDFSDIGDILDSGGPITIPTARNVRLSFNAIGLSDSTNSYWGSEAVSIGGPATKILVRQDSQSELALFLPPSPPPAQSISAVFCQPDSPATAFNPQFSLLSPIFTLNPLVVAAPDIGTRLATAFGVRNNGLAMRAAVGRRIVFGCSAAIRHVIGPDGASITFTSQSDLALHWIVAIRLTLNRDWSWNGFIQNGITVERDGMVVGAFSPSGSVSSDALDPVAAIDRSTTDIIFFDGIDPKPPQGTFPTLLTPRYTVKGIFRSSSAQTQPTSDPLLELDLTLPITTPPAQIPVIASAGIALTPYSPASDYSSTITRARSLWIEFSTPPADPQDSYFARVLRNVPDPLLSTVGLNVNDTDDPALTIDAESARLIVPGQVDDRAGLDAMQLLHPSDSPLYYSLPLLPGLTESSPELFGFFTYELRVGHVGVAADPGKSWSTAQGRFGRPLRVAGIQHPPPPLPVSIKRNHQSITASAPFAAAVLDGVLRQPRIPKTQIWALLYAQAAQMDGSGQMRNILLARVPMPGPVRFQDASLFNGGLVFGSATILFSDVLPKLQALGFGTHAPLSLIAVEMMPQLSVPTDPLGGDLGKQRILRASELTAIASACL